MVPRPIRNLRGAKFFELSLEHRHMQRTFDNNIQAPGNYLAVILLSFASLVSTAHAASDEIVRTPAGVSYVSGGIGEDSITRLNSFAGDFNVKLIFALKSGNFVSDVKVRVADANGKTLVDTTAQGPLFLIRLPKGSYQIGATLADREVKQKISIDSAKLKVFHFRWESE